MVSREIAMECDHSICLCYCAIVRLSFQRSPIFIIYNFFSEKSSRVPFQLFMTFVCSISILPKSQSNICIHFF